MLITKIVTYFFHDSHHYFSWASDFFFFALSSVKETCRLRQRCRYAKKLQRENLTCPFISARFKVMRKMEDDNESIKKFTNPG